jgi:hypothetical protein
MPEAPQEFAPGLDKDLKQYLERDPIPHQFVYFPPTISVFMKF